jgi:hypothetical protein
MRNRLQAGLAGGLLLTAPATALLSAVLAAVLGVALYKLGNPQHQLKAGLGVLALVFLAVVALRPALGLGMVVAAMPFEFTVLHVGTNEVFIFSAAAVLMWRIRTRVVPWWATLGSFALVIGSALSAIGARDPGSAWWGGARWLGVLILFAAAFSVLRDRPDANRRLMDIITCSAVVCVGFAFLQRAGIYMIVGAPYIPGLVSSTFGYYTVYGGFVAMAAVLATGEALQSFAQEERQRGLAYGIALVIILLGVAVSLSRGAVLCLAGGWAVLLILNLRRASFLARGIALIVVFVIAGYVATPAQTRAQFLNRFSAPIGALAEDQQRFALEAVGRHALAQNPLGLGYGNFSFYLSGHQALGTGTTLFFHSHQLPTQVGLDAGWLGLAGFLLLFAGALISAVRARGRGAIRHTAFAAALCGLMAQGLFDYLFYEISMLALWVALVFGASHGVGPRKRLGRTSAPAR